MPHRISATADIHLEKIGSLPYHTVHPDRSSRSVPPALAIAELLRQFSNFGAEFSTVSSPWERTLKARRLYLRAMQLGVPKEIGVSSSPKSICGTEAGEWRFLWVLHLVDGVRSRPHADPICNFRQMTIRGGQQIFTPHPQLLALRNGRQKTQDI